MYKALPFYEQSEDERKRYVEEGETQAAEDGVILDTYKEKSITRTFKAASDSWQAGDLRFTIHSPFFSIPDPLNSPEQECMLALVPAVLAEITVDNLEPARPRRAFFGYQGADPCSHMRVIDAGGLTGVGQGRCTAILTLEQAVKPAQAFTIHDCIDPRRERQRLFGLGRVGCLLMDVPARTKQTFRFALCFHRGGIVTTGLDMSYWYARYFPAIESAGLFALRAFERLRALAGAADALVEGARLSPEQRMQLCLAVRSYYGSTQLLDHQNRPFWVVNEGEYRMMNTFDLAVDQVFFETRMNPWTVRNVLESFAERWSYRDTARLPGQDREQPAGIPFTHDMGVANAFSPPGRSAYELTGVDGCFSYMSREQLVNWVLCAGVYVERSGDRQWLARRMPTLEECFVSMINRDHPEPSKRTGVMKLDGSRAGGSAGITTYDSLDASLGQARGNIYLAVKCWAADVFLETAFGREGRAEWAAQAAQQADRCAATLVGHAGADGCIPAVLDEGVTARIIPAIEGLVFPRYTGCAWALRPDSRFAGLIAALRRHLLAVLRPGVCLFDDGGWKLSSTSVNSWLSKIYLCQFVARTVLGMAWDERGRRSDAAHLAWLLDPRNAHLCWRDQMHEGLAKGSKYYPRGVTSILWLDE